MTNIKQAFTPYSISQDKALVFSIPLYQRLFEWGEEQITQLLDDLYAAYERNSSAAYYIGMLTAKETGRSKELVDGQPRFTAMVLLGIHFGWKDFLTVSNSFDSNELRLQFIARDEDKQYLSDKINGHVLSYKNDKMEKGLEYIANHIRKVLKLEKDKEKAFGEYIYHHLTFFLSKLPDKYSSQELNTYFERMNTSGKSLENYEILKVDIIRRLNDNKEKYTSLWNAVSITEKKILRKHNNESFDTLRNRYLKAIYEIIYNGVIDNAYEQPRVKFDADEEDAETDDVEEIAKANSELSDETPKTIGEIPVNQENPFKIIKRRTDEHSLLTFPEFLLQVLYICLDKDIEEKIVDGQVIEGLNTTDFFDVRKLCNTFKWAFDKRNLNADLFMQKLGLYRLLTDFFIIRMNDEDEEPYPFTLYKANENDKMKVRMFLAMLYSASSAMTYYMWMPDLLCYIEKYVKKENNLDLDAEAYLSKLKDIDNKWHPREEVIADKLTYQNIDRYWFWRIDYYLWEHRRLFFKRELLNIVEKYVFRRNRSIEHIAPQHPDEEYGDKTRFYWDDESHPEYAQKRDCLGNIVMISSGQNSALTNSCFEVKRAVMDRYASGIGNGSVESLKMLYVYSKYNRWSIDNIEDHERFSMDLLCLTYDEEEKEWNDFAKNCESQKN